MILPKRSVTDCLILTSKMSLRTLKFGDRTISYDAGLDSLHYNRQESEVGEDNNEDDVEANVQPPVTDEDGGECLRILNLNSNYASFVFPQSTELVNSKTLLPLITLSLFTVVDTMHRIMHV